MSDPLQGMSAAGLADVLQCMSNEIANLVRDLNTCIGRRHWEEAAATCSEIAEAAGRGEHCADMLDEEQVSELRDKHGGNP